jgi:hypothetical protein
MPVDPRTKARYVAKVESIIERGERLTRAEVRKLKRLVEQARRDVRDLLLAQPTDWQIAHYDTLRVRLEGTIDELRRELIGNQAAFEATQWERGATWTDEMLALFGAERELAGVPLDRTTLGALMDLSADLITKESGRTVEAISTQIQMGILGEKTPYEVMQEVAGTVTHPATFGDTFTRAEAIVRTEGNRVFDIAQAKRQRQWNEQRPGLKKTWHHGGAAVLKPRPAHVQAGIDYDVGGSPGPIPYDEPFIVGGEAMMFPRDPAASPGNTISCHCTWAPWRDEWGE